MKKNALVVFKCLLISSSFLTAQTGIAAIPDKIQIFPLGNYSQDINNYLIPTSPDFDSEVITDEIVREKTENYKKHLFGDLSPWSQSFVTNILNQAPPSDMQNIENNLFQKYKSKCGTTDPTSFAANFKPYPCKWFDEKIAINLNLQQLAYPISYKKDMRSIATDNINARGLPTDEPLYYDFKRPGEGYPFDMLQVSTIWAGSPLYVIGKSKDKAWFLVLTNSGFITWAPSNKIAFTSDSFISKYKDHVSLFGLRVSTKTEAMVSGEDKKLIFLSYIGSIFPSLKQKNKIIVPVRLHDGAAKFKTAIINENEFPMFPLKPTQRNFSTVITNLLERPYGWGGLYSYNDCSQELQSIFTTFGIWLPRNSASQYPMGKILDLSDLDTEGRINGLIQHGRKLVTLVYIKGHIMLYIGNFQNSPWVHNNIWGLRPADSSYRSVIGQSSLIPISSSYPENPSLISLADKTNRPKFILSFLDEENESKRTKRAVDSDVEVINLEQMIFPEVLLEGGNF